MSSSSIRPLHPAALRFARSGLFDGLSAFSQLEARISALPTIAERGEAFEVFAEAYLSTQRIADAAEVWPFPVLPIQLRSELGLDTGRDMGADGVYRTSTGEFRAYQVKFRAGRAPIGWEELGTFMGLTDQVSQRVLITNSDTLPDVLRSRTGFVAIRGNDLDRLEASDFEAMASWVRGTPVVVKRKAARVHQQEALEAIDRAMNLSNRATLVMACGTGKTLVALWAAERSNATRILVLVPSLALVRALLHEWLRETKWPAMSYLCVCSDPTVTKGVDDLVLTQADADFAVSTDPEAVRSFLAKPFDGVKVVFSTYQSAAVVAAGMDRPFQLGIFDEAHRTAGREGTRFSFALEDKNLPIEKRLFFTATPRKYDIRHRTKEGDAKVVYSMDADAVYGTRAYELSFGEAAKNKIICDYKVIISVVTSGMVDDFLLRHGEVIVEGDPVKTRQVALQVALQKAVETYGVRKIFTFHGSVNAAKAFTSPSPEGVRMHLPQFATLHVSGVMPTAVREQHMRAFEQATVAVLSNARCLTEGVDVPTVDMVAFMSPRRSKVDIVQAAGRAMRRAPDKEFGYVLVPVFLELAKGETLEEAVTRSSFDDVWDVLAAMKEEDNILEDVVRELREHKGRTGGFDESRLHERLEVLGPEILLASLRSAIATRCVEIIGDSWDERFGELQAFKVRNGHTSVPNRWPENQRLATWVNDQPQRRKRGTLTAEQIAKLDQLGFVWERRVTKWEVRFAELEEFKGRFGHCRVPDVFPENRDLSTWVQVQRAKYAQGRLANERISRLKALGFEWNVFDAAWERSFETLRQYVAAGGSAANIVLEDESLEKSLRNWSKAQRSSRKRGKLDKDKRERLDAIGFVWDAKEANWAEKIGALNRFKAAHGHCDVPPTYAECGLGRWLQLQRTLFAKGRLPANREAELRRLGVRFDPYAETWEERYLDLMKFKARYGHCKVPQLWEGNPALGGWVQRQRQGWKAGTLLPDLKRRLDEVDFVWDVKENDWEEMFAALIEFKREHKHARVPFNYDRNPKLGWWANTQRQFKKKGKLLPEREKRLNKIGFEWKVNP